MIAMALSAPIVACLIWFWLWAQLVRVRGSAVNIAMHHTLVGSHSARTSVHVLHNHAVHNAAHAVDTGD